MVGPEALGCDFHRSEETTSKIEMVRQKHVKKKRETFNKLPRDTAWSMLFIFVIIFSGDFHFTWFTFEVF